jgi:hypothetical protein
MTGRTGAPPSTTPLEVRRTPSRTVAVATAIAITLVTAAALPSLSTPSARSRAARCGAVHDLRAGEGRVARGHRNGIGMLRSLLRNQFVNAPFSRVVEW